jgi:DNA-binding transcriptional LysR family regulator
VEIGQLEAFLMAVRTHSFSKAAESIGVTQPSLSARILSLERELEEPLFHRVGRGVRLTDAGRAFLPYVQRAMDTLHTGRDAVESSKTASAGKLHIGAARSISTNVLPWILELFHQRHPGVDVAIKTGRSTEVLEWVLTEQIQVGIARELNHPDVVTKHLYDEQVVLVTHPSHRFVAAKSASIQDVASEPLIVYDKESTYFVLIDKICREAGILPNIQMDLDSIESTKRMIERGLGISFLPLNALTREIELGAISQVPLEGDYRITLPTGVMVRKVASYGAIVTAFLDLLNELYTTKSSASSTV